MDSLLRRWRAKCTKGPPVESGLLARGHSSMKPTCIDLHTHIVPEQFPKYAGRNANVPWPSMADAHACHKHVMISGNVYRTVSDGSWSVARRIEAMNEMRVARQVISPMPELL